MGGGTTDRSAGRRWPVLLGLFVLSSLLEVSAWGHGQAFGPLYLATVLGGRLTVAQRRRLLVAAGWLSVVLARLHFEAGERDAAEASREAALRLARQAGNAELVAWTLDAGACWALVDGRYREAV